MADSTIQISISSQAFKRFLYSPLLWLCLLGLIVVYAWYLRNQTPGQKAQSEQAAVLYNGEVLAGDDVAGQRFELAEDSEVVIEVSENTGRLFLQENNKSPKLFETSARNFSQKMFLKKGAYVFSLIPARRAKNAKVKINVKGA